MPRHQRESCVSIKMPSHLLEDVTQQQIKTSDAFDLNEVGHALSVYTPEDFVNNEVEPNSDEE